MTQPVEMTVTRALVEMKRLDRQINEAIAKTTLYISTGKGKKIPNTTFEKAQQDMQASYDEISGLINRRSKIQDAIHTSNANTLVLVGDKSVTVLQAINMKTTAEYQTRHLGRLQALRQQALTNKAKADDQLEAKIDAAILTLVGKDAKASEEQLNLVRTSQEDMYNTEIVDLEKINSRIDSLQKQVDNVVNELDFILSESNAVTKISV